MLHNYTPLCTVLQSRLQGQNIRLNNLLCLNCIIKLLILSQPQYNEVEIYAVCDEMYVFTYIHIYVHEIIHEPCFYIPLICLLLALSSFLSAAIAIIRRYVSYV